LQFIFFFAVHLFCAIYLLSSITYKPLCHLFVEQIIATKLVSSFLFLFGKVSPSTKILKSATSTGKYLLLMLNLILLIVTIGLAPELHGFCTVRSKISFRHAKLSAAVDDHDINLNNKYIESSPKETFTRNLRLRTGLLSCIIATISSAILVHSLTYIPSTIASRKIYTQSV
jgi:hypothetical protein